MSQKLKNLIASGRFEPHPFLRGGQIQTIAGQLLPGAAVPTVYDVELVELGDGDQLALHIDHPTVSEQTNPQPIVLLMHGLGGSSESSYVLRISQKLTKLGYTVVRFNHRGCGADSAHLARQIYHAGRYEDLASTLRHLESRFPQHAVVVVAFSLSANLLLRLLGDEVSASAMGQVRRAMAVCPPIDLEACSQALASLNNKHLDVYFTRRLLATAASRARIFADHGDLNFPRRMSLRLFDELYTAPRAGFKSRDHYYDSSSARHVLRKITLPTTILAAADDPIIPASCFADAPLSSAIDLQLERSGGHMGFIAARPTTFGDRRWMDAAVINWIVADAYTQPSGRDLIRRPGS